MRLGGQGYTIFMPRTVFFNSRCSRKTNTVLFHNKFKFRSFKFDSTLGYPGEGPKGRLFKKRAKSNRNPSRGVTAYEKMAISRLRTNSVEFAQTVRGYFNDLNTGGVGGQSYAVFLQYPSYYRTAAGAIAQLGSITGLLANEQKVFDEYKVTKLTVKYLSWVTGQNRVCDVAVPSATGPAVSPIIIMGTDADDGALWTSVMKALSSQSIGAVMNKYSSGGVHSLTMKQTDSIEQQKWLNLGSIVPSASTPPDPNNPAKLSSVKIWVDAYILQNQVEGDIFCEWEVLFKGSYTLA